MMSQQLNSYIQQSCQMGAIEILKKITQLISKGLYTMKSNSKYLILLAAAILIKLSSYLSARTLEIKTVPCSEFFNPMNMRVIREVLIKGNSILALDKFDNIETTVTSYLPKSYIFDKLHKYKHIIINFEQNTSAQNKILQLIVYFLLSFLTTLAGYMLIKNGTFGSTSHKKQSKNNAGKIKFDDIIGLQQPKQTLKEIITYFFDPQKYRKYGARMRRGLLLYGPSGTGKTSLAKACSNEANVSFFSCNAAQFCEIYVGMGPKKVRDLFEKAKLEAPSIIYIDELDAFGSRSHGGGLHENANSEKNSTINQVLSELDGFDSNQQVLVIGSTNRIQMVDPSLTRAGRFDLKIYTPLPNHKQRVQILEHFLKNKTNDLSEEFLQEIMKDKKNWSGAQIQTMANQSVYESIRGKRQKIEQIDMKRAILRLNGHKENYRRFDPIN